MSARLSAPLSDKLFDKESQLTVSQQADRLKKILYQDRFEDIQLQRRLVSCISLIDSSFD
jgi:hypothetical protein